jgi:hypothetical protein
MYQIITKKGIRCRVEFYYGLIVSLVTRKPVHYAESMSEEYLTQNLNNKLRRILIDDAKNEKAGSESSNP